MDIKWYDIIAIVLVLICAIYFALFGSEYQILWEPSILLGLTVFVAGLVLGYEWALKKEA